MTTATFSRFKYPWFTRENQRSPKWFKWLYNFESNCVVVQTSKIL